MLKALKSYFVDEDPKFNCHSHAALAGANQTLGIIKCTITSRSSAIVIKLYISLVRPKLEYRICIATSINKTDQMAVKSVQRWATKCLKDFKDKEYGC